MSSIPPNSRPDAEDDVQRGGGAEEAARGRLRGGLAAPVEAHARHRPGGLPRQGRRYCDVHINFGIFGPVSSQIEINATSLSTYTYQESLK